MPCRIFTPINEKRENDMSNNPFGNLTNDGLEEAEDRLGGFQPLQSDIYTTKIKAFFAGESVNGAKSVTVIADINGKEYRETLYVTNRNGENFYLNKQDKTKKVPLPGFTTADDICLAATGVSLADQEWEEKVVKLYDSEAKKELPKAVMMAVDVLGKEVSLGIQLELSNKGVKQADGSYVDGPEERQSNTIAKVFHTETKMTMAEARQGKEAGEFWDSWLERNKGEVRDKRTIKDGQGGAKVGAAPKAGASSSSDAPAKKSLFNKKS